MNFQNAHVKDVKADLAKREITLSFTVSLDATEAAQELAEYITDDAGAVEISIYPQQVRMQFSPSTGEIGQT